MRDCIGCTEAVFVLPKHRQVMRSTEEEGEGAGSGGGAMLTGKAFSGGSFKSRMPPL